MSDERRKIGVIDPYELVPDSPFVRAFSRRKRIIDTRVYIGDRIQICQVFKRPTLQELLMIIQEAAESNSEPFDSEHTPRMGGIRWLFPEKSVRDDWDRVSFAALRGPVRREHYNGETEFLFDGCIVPREP